MKLNRTLFTLCLLALPYVCTAQIASVTGYGKHVVDPVTKVKSALYTFRVDATQKGFGVDSFFLGDAPGEAQFYYEVIYKDLMKPRMPAIVIGSPSGWVGEEARMMESNQYEIQWGQCMGVYCVQAGQSSDKFTVKLPKADPAYVSAYYKGSEWVPPPYALRRVIPFDTVAPSFDFSVVTYASGRNATSPRTGWTEVVVTPTISDNYDPYPVSLLDSVTSSDASFVAGDVEVGNGATFGDEVLSFWVKNAPNRQYVVKYTGMDASGNKTKVSKTIWAP